MANTHLVALPLAAVVLQVAAYTLPSLQGEDTTIEEFPWQVSLETAKLSACGGTVLSERWVLTSAACLAMMYSHGFVRSSTSIWQQGGLKYNITRHTPLYREDHDLALVEVYPPFVWSDKLQPVRGLASENPPPGSRVVVTGWSILIDGESARQLRKMTVSLRDCHECGRDTDDEICGKGLVRTDDGHPVFDEKTKVLVGIVRHFGELECSGGTKSTWFSSVANLRDWITKNSGLTFGHQGTSTERL